MLEFRDALLSAYREKPCQVLPNALWKTMLDGLNTSLQVEGDSIFHLKAWDNRRIMVAWDRDRSGCSLFQGSAAGFDIALVHQDYLACFPKDRYCGQRAYFRFIYYPGNLQPRATLPPGIRLVPVNIPLEAPQVAELIWQCYPDIHPTLDEVRGWSRRWVFNPGLWVWAVDEEREIPVGLGIAEEDLQTGEGSLEWIQVLPAFQGRGIGKCLVVELLSRLENRVQFTTVAGEVDNATHPQALYRRCGFTGEDIWWMLVGGKP